MVVDFLGDEGWVGESGLEDEDEDSFEGDDDFGGEDGGCFGDAGGFWGLAIVFPGEELVGPMLEEEEVEETSIANEPSSSAVTESECCIVVLVRAFSSLLFRFFLFFLFWFCSIELSASLGGPMSSSFDCVVVRFGKGLRLSESDDEGGSKGDRGGSMLSLWSFGFVGEDDAKVVREKGLDGEEGLEDDEGFVDKCGFGDVFCTRVPTFGSFLGLTMVVPAEGVERDEALPRTTRSEDAEEISTSTSIADDKPSSAPIITSEPCNTAPPVEELSSPVPFFFFRFF